MLRHLVAFTFPGLNGRGAGIVPALTRDYVEDRCYDGICTGGRTRPYTGVCPGGHAARYTGVTDGQVTFQSGCGTHLVPVRSAGAAVGAQS